MGWRVGRAQSWDKYTKKIGVFYCDFRKGVFRVQRFVPKQGLDVESTTARPYYVNITA